MNPEWCMLTFIPWHTGRCFSQENWLSEQRQC